MRDDLFWKPVTSIGVGGHSSSIASLFPGERDKTYDLYLFCELDRRQNFVILEPWRVEFTPDDVAAGEHVLHVPDDADLFQVNFLRDGEPIRNETVKVYLESRSLEVSTGSNGLVALGDPTGAIFAAEGDYQVVIGQIPVSVRTGRLERAANRFARGHFLDP